MQQTETTIFSVSDISFTLKSYVEQTFSAIRVKGEVSGLKKAPSGHIYFSLKDENAVLSAVCWRGRDFETLKALQEGLEIICLGKISTYPGRSTYQMIVEHAEPAGIGALLKLLNERKEKLEKEGLFSQAHKKKIPFLPQTVGVITSPTGAVIRDILHRLSERFPRHVVLWPVLVQGDEAAEQVCAALKGFNSFPETGLILNNKKIPKPDVLIVARGGGSFEDLWPFNEESIVRAVYESKIPVISAIGHETDTTLIDYAADLRAPTPTGAAEKAVPVRTDLVARLQVQEGILLRNIHRYLENQTGKLELLTARFPLLSDMIEHLFQKLDDFSERLTLSMRSFLTMQEQKSILLDRLLESYSYSSVLKRGFSLITSPQNKIISDLHQAQKEKKLTIVFHNGTLPVHPQKTSPTPKSTFPQQKGLFDDL